MNENTGIKEIASRIADLRDICGFTVKEMAEFLDVTEQQYLDYENAKVDFPVSILYALASKFGVDLTEILTGVSPKLTNCSLVRKGRGIAVDRYKGYDFESIAYKFIGRKIEPMIVTVGPETEINPPAKVSHSGQEFNFVLEGSIKVSFGDTDFFLEEGDCFYFDPTVPHAQSACGGKAARFLTVILL
ncbi:MAG: cupin domain-containing protein [Clostridia bacterium]|nr:cupin domain-containing protein [Clostridia bacterium]